MTTITAVEIDLSCGGGRCDGRSLPHFFPLFRPQKNVSGKQERFEEGRGQHRASLSFVSVFWVTFDPQNASTSSHAFLEHPVQRVSDHQTKSWREGRTHCRCRRKNKTEHAGYLLLKDFHHGERCCHLCSFFMACQDGRLKALGIEWNDCPSLQFPKGFIFVL